MPKGPHGRGLGAPSGSVHAFAINKYTKYPEEAWRFLKFLVTEPEAALARELNSVAGPRYPPVARLWMEQFPPSRKEWLQIGLLYEEETPPAVASTPVTISYDDRQAILQHWLSRFYSGSIPIREALAGMEQQLNAKLAEARARMSS